MARSITQNHEALKHQVLYHNCRYGVTATRSSWSFRAEFYGNVPIMAKTDEVSNHLKQCGGISRDAARAGFRI